MVLVLTGPAAAATPAIMKIRITITGKAVEATLVDNVEASREVRIEATGS